MVAYLASDVIEALDSACTHNYPGTALGKQTCSRLTDSAACSGDSDDLSFDAVIPLPCVGRGATLPPVTNMPAG